MLQWYSECEICKSNFYLLYGGSFCMELNLKLSKKDFTTFRYHLFRIHPKRLFISICCQIFLSIWLVVPFIKLWMMGMHYGVSFGNVLRAYPNYMLAEGWLSPLFGVVLVVFFLCTPSFLSAFNKETAYQQYLKYESQTMVLSRWRFCLYGAEHKFLSALPYNNIQKILWLENCIAIILVNGMVLSINTHEVTEENQERLVQYLAKAKNLSLEPSSCLSFSSETWKNCRWAKNISITEKHLQHAFSMFGYTLKQQYKTIMAIFIFLLIGSIFFQGLRWISLLLIVGIVALAKPWIPGASQRSVKRMLKKIPTWPKILSGNTYINEDGLYRCNGLCEMAFYWKHLSHTIVGQKGICVFAGNRIAAFLPAEYFSGKQEMLEMSHWMQQQIEQNKKQACNPTSHSV